MPRPKTYTERPYWTVWKIFGIAILIVVVVGAGATAVLVYAPKLQSGTGTCPYGGTYPNCLAGPSNTCQYGGVYPACNPAPSTPTPGIYSGTVNFLVNEYWAYDGSGFVFTTAAVNVYRPDGLTIQGTPSIGGANGAGTSTGINMQYLASDNGVAILGYLAAKNSATFIDPAYTLTKNACPPNTPGKGCLKSVQFNVDANGDSIYDVEFIMDLSGFSNTNPNLTPAVTIGLYGWKVTTTNAGISSTTLPTGATNAGTYTASGYITDTDGNGYEIRVLTWRLWASQDDTPNATAGSLSTIVSNQGFTLTGVALSGKGMTTQAMYGMSWGTPYSTLGVPNFPIPTYDTANTRWILYAANSGGVSSCGCLTGSSFDTSQIEWGMPIIFERNSPTSWFTYQIQFKVTQGALTANDYYYLFLEGISASGTSSADASSDALEYKIKITG